MGSLHPTTDHISGMLFAHKCIGLVENDRREKRFVLSYAIRRSCWMNHGDRFHPFAGTLEESCAGRR
jgi:hypothetical protein